MPTHCERSEQACLLEWEIIANVDIRPYSPVMFDCVDASIVGRLYGERIARIGSVLHNDKNLLITRSKTEA